MSNSSLPAPFTRRRFFKQSIAASAGLITASGTSPFQLERFTKPVGNLWVTDLKCAVIGGHPVIRITTNAGVSGYGMAEYSKPYLKPFILYYQDYVVGMDPTDVERIMIKIRRLGGFKPWGAAVSAIEMALWDIAGKVAGVPVYKLLGGKIRDKVRVYSGGGKPKMIRYDPEEYAEVAAWVKEAKEGYTMAKFVIGFHSAMAEVIPDFFYGEVKSSQTPAPAGNSKINPPPSLNVPYGNRGNLTEKGFKHIMTCVEAVKKVLGDDIGVAFDVGPGHTISDAIKLARAMEPYHLLWLEDLLTGDYTPFVMADLYREVTMSTSTPIHTGEQIYLRQHFRELFEKKAVNVVGPDPADVGGIAELKWVAEYADLHGIQMAPHGVLDGLLGLAAHVQVGAAMPENYIAFEYPTASTPWWYDIVEGLPDPIVKDGHIEVWDRPGMGVDLIVKEAKKYLEDEDKGFFD